MKTNAMSRCYLESKLVVLLAGRVAEKLVFGFEGTSKISEADLTTAKAVSQDMVFKYGLGRRLGPVNFSSSHIDYLSLDEPTKLCEDIDPVLLDIGLADMSDILTAAKAKAHFGLANN